MKTWDMDELIKRHSPRLPCDTPISPVRHTPINPNDITYERLKEAYLSVAMIVAEHGECYLPIFERLDKELQKAEKNQSLLDKAFRIAKGSTP